MKVLLVLGVLLAVSCAVPTPERIREVFPGRTDLLDRISSFGRLFAQDAHRVYRRSFDGLKLNDLDAMLDQLVDGQGRLWDLLDRFSNDQESSDSESLDSEEDENPQEMFRELISQLSVDPDSMAVLLSGEDRLEVDGKRLECMLELLDKLSKKIVYYIGSLDEDRDMLGWTFVKRYLKSGLRVVLRVINSIKNVIQDAVDEVAIDDGIEIPDDNSEELETQFGEDSVETTDELEVNEDDWADEAAFDLGQEKYPEGGNGRSKRSTVTAASRFHNLLSFGVRRRGPTPFKTDLGDSSSTALGGGFSASAAGLMWKNPKHRGHRGGF